MLSGQAQISGRVVVIGGGLVGLEVAEYLHGSVEEVTVVEMLDAVGKDLGQLRNICVMESLYAAGIKTITSAKCVEINESGVVIEKDGNKEELPCDAVVAAIGVKSRNFELISKYCEEKGLPCHAVGDAVRARRALNAIAEASDLARSI